MAAQLNANQKIQVTLEAQQWNAVLSQLAEAPWRIADPLIDAIRSQCMSHEQNEIDAVSTAAE